MTLSHHDSLGHMFGDELFEPSHVSSRRAFVPPTPSAGMAGTNS